MTMTGPVGGASPVTDTLVCASPSEGRATTVGGTPSACVGSAACLGSATAAFPVGKKVKNEETVAAFVRFERKRVAEKTPPASRGQMQSRQGL